VAAVEATFPVAAVLVEVVLAVTVVASRILAALRTPSAPLVSAVLYTHELSLQTVAKASLQSYASTGW
jgi:hypothetical protein